MNRPLPIYVYIINYLCIVGLPLLAGNCGTSGSLYQDAVQLCDSTGPPREIFDLVYDLARIDFQDGVSFSRSLESVSDACGASPDCQLCLGRIVLAGYNPR